MGRDFRHLQNLLAWDLDNLTFLKIETVKRLMYVVLNSSINFVN